MKKVGKKSLIITLAAVAAAVGISTGVLAQGDEEGTTAAPEARQAALLERVSEIYEENTGVAIDDAELQNAFTAAQDELRAEAFEDHLAKLVEAGVITADEAEEIRDWMESRPDVTCPQCPAFGGEPAGRPGPSMGGSRMGGLGVCPGGDPGMMGPWGDNAPDADGA